jgi:hypothetical protein
MVLNLSSRDLVMSSSVEETRHAIKQELKYVLFLSAVTTTVLQALFALPFFFGEYPVLDIVWRFIRLWPFFTVFFFLLIFCWREGAYVFRGLPEFTSGSALLLWAQFFFNSAFYLAVGVFKGPYRLGQMALYLYRTRDRSTAAD